MDKISSIQRVVRNIIKKNQANREAIQRLAEGTDKLTPEKLSEHFQSIPIRLETPLERSPQTDTFYSVHTPDGGCLDIPGKLHYVYESGFETPANNISIQNRNELHFLTDAKKELVDPSAINLRPKAL